jgi:hypothetical protein
MSFPGIYAVALLTEILVFLNASSVLGSRIPKASWASFQPS